MIQKKKSKEDPDGPFFDASKLSKYSLRKYKLYFSRIRIM